MKFSKRYPTRKPKLGPDLRKRFLAELSQNQRSPSVVASQLLQRLPFKESHVILFVALLALGGYTISLTDNLLPGGDNAHYLVLADALQSGQGYRSVGAMACVCSGHWSNTVRGLSQYFYEKIGQYN
jgi:hypothetical protein